MRFEVIYKKSNQGKVKKKKKEWKGLEMEKCELQRMIEVDDEG